MAEPEKVAESEALPLRLQWRQSWPDREADYVAETPEHQGGVGRIYLYDGGPQKGLWFWAMNAFGPEVSRNVGILTGVERSARAAARMVEDAWFATIGGSSPDAPTPKHNVYELAKEGERLPTWYLYRGPLQPSRSSRARWRAMLWAGSRGQREARFLKFYFRQLSNSAARPDTPSPLGAAACSELTWMGQLCCFVAEIRFRF
jgi:hypothetical protein